VTALVAAFLLDDATRVRRGFGPELLPALWVFDGVAPRPWQLMTYVFVHAFRAHLVSNLTVLVPASLLAEWRLGPARLVLAFVTLAVAVSLGFWVLDDRDLYGVSGVGAGFVGLAATLWLGARERSWPARVTPSVLAVLYFGVVEVWPAVHGHASRGHLPHAIGACSGVMLGAWLVRRMQRVQVGT
jgi:membrane associated rhomboid family serine protease